MTLTGHHIYLLAPGASMAEIRHFYGQVLALPEVKKPKSLADNPVLWFGAGTLVIHVGHPGQGTVGDGHTALSTPSVPAARAHCLAMGCAVNDDVIPMGYDRFYISDPWGNQFEILPDTLP